MPRLTAEQWSEARALREGAGLSLREISARMNVDRAAVSRRAKREQWDNGANLAATLHRKVTEKVTGIVNPADHKKTAAAIDAEAARRAGVIDKHRDELEAARQMALAAKENHQNVGEHQIAEAIRDPMERQQILLVMKRRAFEDLKAAKIHVETLKLVQDGERKAWGLDMPVDLSSLTDEQLAALAAGRMPV
ncbi:helix-turn-helix domain-containing protein [Thioalkalivibrio paradoxus]|uniref:Uncharacterized protein n=1 Tax=Thioalkalivibrio paradoxus ARh 1 TaxID=713585 RepID=W0DR96_9GAMM|nr:hypothetical protein [Thioalkalivibrio paradoxus]AHE99380.1 hypothetical protein THITH_15050 [Thioalkalivibrio paradoxus ARh 1]